MIIDEKREMIGWSRWNERSFGSLVARLPRSKPHGLTPLFHALYRIGPEAEPLVIEALQRRRNTASESKSKRISAIDALYATVRNRTSEGRTSEGRTSEGRSPDGTGSVLFERVSYDDAAREPEKMLFID